MTGLEGTVPQGRERRVAARAGLQVPILVDARSAWRTGRGRDVSVSGLRLMADDFCRVGAFVDVYFELPLYAVVEALAQVVRVDAAGVAVSFVDLALPHRLALRDYVASCNGGDAFDPASCTRLRRYSMAAKDLYRFERKG